MALRSGESLDGQWLDINQHGAQGRYHKGEIIASREAMETRRPRILLGEGPGMRTEQPQMEYDMTHAYEGGVWVHVGANNAAVTTGTTDPNSGTTVKSQAGWYLSAPGGVGVIGGDSYNIPQWPLPNTTDIASPLNFWIAFIPDSTTSASATTYKITSTTTNSNYVVAVDASNSSHNIYKPLELQGGLGSESIYGDTVTYSSYSSDWTSRTASDSSGNSETQYITPAYVVNEIITAVTVTAVSGFTFPSGTGFPTTGTYLLEISPARQWGGVD